MLSVLSPQPALFAQEEDRDESSVAFDVVPLPPSSPTGLATTLSSSSSWATFESPSGLISAFSVAVAPVPAASVVTAAEALTEPVGAAVVVVAPSPPPPVPQSDVWSFLGGPIFSASIDSGVPPTPSRSSPMPPASPAPAEPRTRAESPLAAAFAGLLGYGSSISSGGGSSAAAASAAVAPAATTATATAAVASASGETASSASGGAAAVASPPMEPPPTCDAEWAGVAVSSPVDVSGGGDGIDGVDASGGGGRGHYHGDGGEGGMEEDAPERCESPAVIPGAPSHTPWPSPRMPGGPPAGPTRILTSLGQRLGAAISRRIPGLRTRGDSTTIEEEQAEEEEAPAEGD